MFFNGKRIVYLHCYENNEKGGSAGFARFLKEKDGYRLDLTIRKMQEWEDGKYQIILEGYNKNICLGDIALMKGEGTAVRSLSVKEDTLYYRTEEEMADKLYGIAVYGSAGKRICGYWKEPEITLKAAGQEDNEMNAVTEVNGLTEMNEVTAKWEQVEDYAADKWQQLCKVYTRVHPFGDAREFIVIEPKDFIILRYDYQKLVNNSFLLHGFYNYRHIILGPQSGLGNEQSFYLGVPGVFYEREKMVAVMFGFEGFECNGPVESGKFGYYMRLVEL